MDTEIRPITHDEIDAFMVTNFAAFGGRLDQEQAQRYRAELTELDRTLAGMAAGRAVATAAAFSMELTLPGLVVVPAAGISWVGVLPTHRRQGLLSALMRRQLDDVHERGEAISMLTASEGAIYGRYGYGPATVETVWELDRAGARWRQRPDPGAIELVDTEAARPLLAQVHDAARRAQAGDVRPHPAWWDEVVRDAHRNHDGLGAKFFALHHTSGAADGYAVYRIPEKEQWSSDRTAEVVRMAAVTPSGYMALWGYLADLDLTARVRARHRPADEPLRWALADPRQLRVTEVEDWLWLRLVDLPAALAARRYAVEGSVVVGVSDPLCPWNEGRWRLEGGPDGAECLRVGAQEDAELALDTSAVASAYLGGVGLEALAWAGRVAELVPGALARAGAMFATDRLPWCSTSF